MMTGDGTRGDEGSIRWDLCTWEGARRAQLRAYRQLSLLEKLEAVEQMCAFSRLMAAARRRRGLRATPEHGDPGAMAENAAPVGAADRGEDPEKGGTL